MIKSLSITIVSLVLLLTSCGQQHEAEALVEDFMDKNMKDEVSINARRFTDIDSTFLPTTSSRRCATRRQMEVNATRRA